MGLRSEDARICTVMSLGVGIDQGRVIVEVAVAMQNLKSKTEGGEAWQYALLRLWSWLRRTSTSTLRSTKMLESS